MKRIVVLILVTFLSFQLYAQRLGHHTSHIVIEGIKALTMSPSDYPGMRKIQAEQNARIKGMSSPRLNPAVPFYHKSKDSLKHLTHDVVRGRYKHNNFLDSIKNTSFDIRMIDKTGNRKIKITN